jgi:hypothetical protein
MVTWNLQWELGVGANCQVGKQKTEDNLENEEEYVGIT